MSNERRKYLRVLFEKTIQVAAEDWTDSMATGLNISLNGVRFHHEYALSEGDQVTIQLSPDLKLVGKVRWCWPIKWYFQTAVEFIDLSTEEQNLLREYISNTTGQPYPENVEEMEEEGQTEAFEEEILFEEEEEILFDEERDFRAVDQVLF